MFEYEYSEKRVILSDDVDFLGNMKLNRIFQIFSVLATTHAQKIGMWSEEIAMNYAWIVSKQRLEMTSPIRLGDEVEFVTVVQNGSQAIFPRYYYIKRQGEIIASCSSIWTMLDIHKRRIVAPKRIGIDIPKVEHDYMLEQPPTIEEENLDFVTQRQVLYSDIDMNYHMNNTRYIEWCLDLLPIDFFQNQFIKDIAVMYMKEIRPNECVSLYMKKDSEYYVVEGRDETDTKCFVVKIVC